MGWSPERLADEIDLLGSRALPREEFFAELSPRLRKVIAKRRQLLAHARTRTHV